MKRQGVIKIHSPSPYEKLDATTANWLKHFKAFWSLWKSSPAISEMLFNFFFESENPYKSALNIMVSSGDFYVGKSNSLAHVIMKNFASWVETQNISDIPKPLKFDAMNLVMRQCNLDLIKLVIDVFRMREDKEMFINHINELIKKKNYKEACQLVCFLSLQENFGIMEFLVPLLFQDKFVIVETFLDESKKHQLEMAAFLDDLIGKKNILHECHNIIGNLNIIHTKVSFHNHRPLSKQLTKIIKKYNLSPSDYPNIHRKRGRGVLQFLLHKRYIDKTIGGESWTEMVLETIGDDETLHESLVENLTSYRDLKEALTWAERLGVPQESWPIRLKEYSRRNREGESSWQENLEDPCSFKNERVALKFHKFPLDESQIKLIDTATGFCNFLDNIINVVDIVGVDAEWKPSFGIVQTDLAVIQVATYDVVYILDVIALLSAAPQPLWERFGSFLFDSPNILKIGFGTREDLTLFRNTFRKMHCLKIGWNAKFLDLAVLWKTLVSKYKFVFPYSSNSQKISGNLSRLVQECLGEVLDKSDQFSNWENRPLRKSQILYAGEMSASGLHALDAYCLLEIYGVILKESKTQNIPIADVVDKVLYGNAAVKTKKRGRKVFYND